jgi:general secretion pathway protein D
MNPTVRLSFFGLLSRTAWLPAALLIAGCSQAPSTRPVAEAESSPPITTESTSVTAPAYIDSGTGKQRNNKDSVSPVEPPKVSKSHIFKGSGVRVKAPNPEKPASASSAVNLNFEGADIRDIAKTVLAEILGQNYVVDPKVQGTISLRTTRPLPRDALLPTLETALRLNGIVIIKENDVFKIMPAAAAKGSLSPKMGTSGAGFSLQIVPLGFVGAREMAKILENVAADPALVKADEFRNLLFIAGTQNEIRHMLDTIEMFDVDWMSGMSVGLFVLQSADVKSVDQDLKKVFGEKGGGDPFAGVVRFVPIERMNAFVIITPQPKYLDQAKLWLERLDRVGGGGGTRLFVYQVQNGKAEHLAELLNQTFGNQQNPANKVATQAPQVAPGLTGTLLSSGTSAAGSKSLLPQGTGTAGISAVGTSNMQAQQAAVSATSLSITGDSGGAAEQVRVVADPRNNALLILANASGYEKIESALKKLDNAPRQVLIELMIAEVSLKDELSYGVEWLFTNGARRSGKLDLGTEGLNALVPGFSYAITSATDGSIKSILNMLATDNKLNILSSPHVMVADNQTAKIQVGDSVPTAGPQTISGTGLVVSSVQYLDTGVILAVTPRINAGGLVNLDIVQEVSTATTTTTSGLNSPTISRRSAQTSLSVQSGETIVMGGLISERSNNGSTGLPLLSEIPILGGLFGKQSKSSERTELILLITPRVANNFNQAKMLSDELRKKMGDVKDLVDCGTSNLVGYTTRGGLWCQQKPLQEEPNRIISQPTNEISMPAAGEALR